MRMLAGFSLAFVPLGFAEMREVHSAAIGASHTITAVNDMLTRV